MGNTKHSTTFLGLYPIASPENVKGVLDRDGRYGYKEILKTVRLYHNLPNDMSIKIDISRVYSWMNREDRTIFDMYAAGLEHSAVGAYMYLLDGRSEKLSPSTKCRGTRAIRRMIKNLSRYMEMRQGSISYDGQGLSIIGGK